MLGALALVDSAVNYRPESTARFLCMLAMAGVGSTWKIVLPGLQGSLSVGYVLVMIGIIDMSLGETVAMGVLGAVAGTLWRARIRPRSIQVIFNCASIVASVAAAWHVYRNWEAWISPQYRGVDLAAAAAVYFLFNTAFVAFFFGITGQKNFVKVWYNTYFWAFPYYVVGAVLAACAGFLSRSYGWPAAFFVLPFCYVIYRSFRLYIDRLESDKQHAQAMAELHFRTVEALALAIEAKDDYTHDHLNRVYVYATEIARELDLSPDEMKALEAAAILHDIGKIAVPDFIISKPGKLTPAEFQKVKIHPVVGGEIVSHVQFPYPVAPLVRGHHEKWNGMGYPDGLAGEGIPLGARILAVVDCFDALTSDRQYRRALPIEKALGIIVNESGRAFDPRVVEVLRRRAFELEQKAKASAKVALKLSLNTHVERGARPDAGFEESAGDLTPAGCSEPASPGTMAALWPDLAELTSTARHCRGALSETDLLSMLFVRLAAAIPHDGGAFYVRSGNILIPRYAHGQDSNLFGRLRIPLGSGLSGWVAQSGFPIFNGNPAVEFGHLLDGAQTSDMKSALVIPLLGPNYAAVLALYHRRKEAFQPDQLKSLTALGPEILAVLTAHRKETMVAPEREPSQTPAAILDYLDRQLRESLVQPQPISVLILDDIHPAELSGDAGRRPASLAAAIGTAFSEETMWGHLGGSQYVAAVAGVPHHEISERIQALKLACGPDLAAGAASFPNDGDRVETLLARAYQRLEADRALCPSFSDGLRSLHAALAPTPVPAASVPR